MTTSHRTIRKVVLLNQEENAQLERLQEQARRRGLDGGQGQLFRIALMHLVADWSAAGRYDADG